MIFTGTVTGTEYQQASDEIEITASSSADELAVLVSFSYPGIPPYSECEEFRIGNYQIVDTSGENIVKGAVEQLSEIHDGRVEISIPVDGLKKGDYKLIITQFIGESKGDQPLMISGLWECDFIIE